VTLVSDRQAPLSTAGDALVMDSRSGVRGDSAPPIGFRAPDDLDAIPVAGPRANGPIPATGDGPIDVSISVVTYNTGARLLQCIESVQETAGDLRYEVFVVDNSSSDDTDIQIYRNFPNVRLILNERNVGFARANNQAILLSRGRYVFVTNPDIVVRPHALQRMVDYLDEHSDVGVVACRLEYPDGSLQLSCRSFPTLASFLIRGLPLPERLKSESRVMRQYLLSDWDHASTREVDWCLGSCLLVRRETIEAVGGMDSRFFLYYEDIDW
jgi:GT2 family glycosyltransferase